VNGLVDIHTHLLPGIDDGPDDLDQSLAMAGAAADAGTATIAATPHLRADFPDVHVEELAGRCRALREAIEDRGIPVRVVPGAEVSLAWAIDASDEELALASYGQRGTDLLVETPTTGAAAIEAAIAHLQGKGFRITLAHPERGLAFQRNPEKLRPLVERGLLLAVNAESLLGPRASPPRRAARRLCVDGLAHVLASDGHRGAQWRPVTVLEAGAAAAADLVGEERASWMTRAAPAAVLDGTELPVAPPVRRARRAWPFG
jgi:protein-tyrosine phosphatase